MLHRRMMRAPRNGGASVSGAAGVFEAHGALSKSLAMYHRDQMLANAVSQRAAWVLVLQPLKYRLSDAASAHDAPRNGGASVSGAAGVFEAHGAHSAGALRCGIVLGCLANAVSLRAAWVLMPRPQIYSVSSAYRWAVGAENRSHLFWGQS